MSFLCGLRGYHIYRTVWDPSLNERLDSVHEPNNAYDRYAIAATKHVHVLGQTSPVIVGHIPKELSRITRYIMLHGATVTVIVRDM